MLCYVFLRFLMVYLVLLRFAMFPKQSLLLRGPSLVSKRIGDPVVDFGSVFVASRCLPLPPVCGFPLAQLSPPSLLPPVASRLWLRCCAAFASVFVASRCFCLKTFGAARGFVIPTFRSHMKS